jgi:hypothetical protein
MLLTSSFMMLASAALLCLVLPFKYTLDFMQPHTKKSDEGTVGQVTEGAMAQVRLFLTVDQQNVHRAKLLPLW